MALRDSSHDRFVRPIAVEFALVTAGFVGLSLWARVVRTFVPRVGSDVGFPLSGLLFGGLSLAGVTALVWGYAAARDLTPGLSRPSRADSPFLGLAVGTPLALVALTKLVGVTTGVPYNALTRTAYGVDPPLSPIASLVALELLVAVPALVAVFQVLVQGSFGRVVGDDAAVLLTAFVAGITTIGHVDGLAVVPERGRLAGIVLLALLLGGAAFATGRLDDRRLRVAAYGPVVALVGLMALSAVAAVDTVAGGLFAVTQFATLGVGAYTYDRTGSPAGPALAYATLLVANRAVVLAFEAGMQSW